MAAGAAPPFERMDLSKLNARTTYRDDRIPDMGLKHDCNYPFRVYVLLCAGFCYYVGISPVDKLVDRIQEHFSGSGAHYCRVHKPQAVLMAWPALLESVEALVYFTMQQKLFYGGRGDCGKLGGWVQTSSKPSPLCVMQCEQTRRQLLGKCFVCVDGRHSAGSPSCSGADNNTVQYRCGECSAYVTIDSRGASSTRKRKAAAPAPLQVGPPTVATAQPAPKLRRAQTAWAAAQESMSVYEVGGADYVELQDVLKAAGAAYKRPGQKVEHYKNALKLRAADVRRERIRKCQGPPPYVVTTEAAEKIFLYEKG